MTKKQPTIAEVTALLQAKWPSAIVARTRIAELTGGLITTKTLSNDDSAGRGIKRRYRAARKVAYRIEDVAEYLIEKGFVMEELEAKDE